MFYPLATSKLSKVLGRLKISYASAGIYFLNNGAGRGHQATTAKVANRISKYKNQDPLVNHNHPLPLDRYRDRNHFDA